jgi:RNA polymerase sigma-70 factor, ECF subfamily
VADDRQDAAQPPADTQVSDGDLVRLARDGDPVAFRLLIERHQPGVRSRALRLAADRHEADDIVQEAFLQAFTSLPSLRDPERFAGWLAGIVLNVHRAIRRRAPLALVGDWPEALHPLSAVGLPSAEDIDRAAALRAAVAELPARQREAVELFYYADLPVDQIGESPGAAKASLFKARIRLRAYLAEHRADLIPAPSRRSPVINVRIAHAEPLPGPQPDGNYNFDQVLVVLADDAGNRALPLWLNGFDGDALWRLLDRPRSAAELDALPREMPAEALTITVLLTAGARVTGVEIDELGPDVTAAHVDFTSGAARPGRVTSRLGAGLALAVAAAAPVRVAGPLFDRLAVPVDGDDLLGPFLPGAPEPGRG